MAGSQPDSVKITYDPKDGSSPLDLTLNLVGDQYCFNRVGTRPCKCQANVTMANDVSSHFELIEVWICMKVNIVINPVAE